MAAPSYLTGGFVLEFGRFALRTPPIGPMLAFEVSTIPGKSIYAKGIDSSDDSPYQPARAGLPSVPSPSASIPAIGR